MKYVTAILIMFMLVTDNINAAAWYPPQARIQTSNLIFLEVRNEYQLRYSVGGLPRGTANVRANFWSASDVYYSTIFENPTGIAYLTCNGTYIFEVLDAYGDTIAETERIVTSRIVNPSCTSYENSDLRDDLNIQDVDGDLTWNDYNGAQYYCIYRNGKLLTQLSASEQSYTPSSGGLYTVVAASNVNCEHLASSDYLYKTCDACDVLTSMIACPAWNEVMGDITDAIRDALPPPTDWDMVASTFINHLSDYFGDVPPLPSQSSIINDVTPSMPIIDTTVPDADITLIAPTAFNEGVLDTDITTGYVIDIVDDSEAFEIYEPDDFLDSDDIGVFVYPNDERNSSGGIKEPDTIDTDYPMPTPQPIASSAIPTPQPIASSAIP